MTSVPYPTFLSLSPVDKSSDNRVALPAVGRCRVHPESCTSSTEEYRAIVSKCIDQSFVDENVDKKTRKKLMKEGVAMARTYLMETLGLDVSVVDVEIVVTPKDLVESDGCLASCLLDAGALAIVTDGTALAAMDAAKVPRERMVAHFSGPSSLESSASSSAELSGVFPTQALREAAALAGMVSVQLRNGEEVTADDVLKIINSAKRETEDAGFEMVVQFRPADVATLGTEDEQGKETALADLVGMVSRGCDGRGSVSLIDPSARELGLGYAACLRTDREDGLFTTVVCTRGGEALGLVYSSKESIIAALECGRGVYYSRSRNGLWRKGDTSGHYQSLHRIDVDCDSDALRFTVTQRGDDVAAFCHLNTLTCWGEPRGLRHLEGTLKQRLREAPEGSYTKRLFDDKELLRDKLVEEAQELSEAESPQHVAEELADILYFAMVRAAKAGVSIDDAAAELDRRARKVTRRKGDSKAFRIAAGDAILNKSKEVEAPKDGLS